MSLLGTGAVRPGRACDRAGTSEGINLCTESYIEDPRLMGYGHVVEPWFNVSGIISTTGKALEWIRRGLGREELDYDTFTSAAAEVSPGAARLLFSALSCRREGLLIGIRARAALLSGSPWCNEGPHMIRAVLESAGFAIRDVIEVMGENGAVVEDLRITGGPSRSPLWNQIKADISGRRLLVPMSSESELLGNLAVGLRTLGDCGDLAEAADRIVEIGGVFEPDPEKSKVYDELFQIYRTGYSKLKDVFAELSGAV